MYNIKAIAGLFDLRGDYVFGEPYGSGHINDTYRVVVDQAGLRVSYILQRINSNVFKQPIPLMENVKRVTDEALRVLLAEGCKEAYRRTLTIVNAKDGKPSCHSCGGSCGGSCGSHGASDDLVAQITKKVMEQLGK